MVYHEIKIFEKRGRKLFFGIPVIQKKTFVSHGALSLIECVTVEALKLPVPSTDVLKPHESQRFSSVLRKLEKVAYQKEIKKNLTITAKKWYTNSVDRKYRRLL